MRQFIDLKGQLFGRLRVTSFAGRDRYGRAMWLCQCEVQEGGCGTPKVVSAGNLRSGHATSCGCLSRERLRARNFKHGRSEKRRVTPEFTAWIGMKQRCMNPRTKYFADYGGRGITVCERWRDSFESFLADMGPRPSPAHSLDRIDNAKGYEPGNVRWATDTEQACNRRSNTLVTHNGETLCIAEWACRTNLKAHTIRRRLELGWSPAEALTTPVNGMRGAVCPPEYGPGGDR